MRGHGVRTTKMYQPDAIDRFQCIGTACEDTCCTGWIVHVDRKSYERYRSLPEGPLQKLLTDHLVQIAPEIATENWFATITMGEDGFCPLLDQNHLCRVHQEMGSDALGLTCKQYPRQEQIIDGLLEVPLMLSCPEAARVVLLDPEPPGTRRAQTMQLTWDDTLTDPKPMRTWFWQIRAFAVELLLNRTYPLWQRMFLLGSFSRRLQAIQSGELDRGFPALLADFEAAVEAGSLRRAMDTLQPDLRLQIDIVLRFIALRAWRSHVSDGFRVCLDNFVEGIGQNKGASDEEQISRYRNNYALYYAPLFARHPYVLENYLVHTVFRERFPLGKSMFVPEADGDMGAAYTQLAVQFALVKGMLIGVSGHYGSAFSLEHVISTVYAVCRQFEHCPQFLDLATQILAERNLNNAHGLTMLLRN